MSYIAGRKFKLFGKDYNKGDEVAAATELPLQRQKTMVSSGHLMATVLPVKKKTVKTEEEKTDD